MFLYEHQCITNLLASHVEVSNQIFVISVAVHSGDDRQVRCWVVSLDEGVNGFLDKARSELGGSEQTPNSGVVATLSKLVRTINVLDVLQKNLAFNNIIRYH